MMPVQETPQIFSLLLVLAVLASLVILLVVAYRLIRGRRRSAVSLLARWSAGVVVYLAISLLVSATTSARIIEPRQNWCFDDWCIAIEGVHRRSSVNGHDVTVTTDIRIYNAARSPEGARGFWAYLRDQDDRRFTPSPGTWQEVVVARVPPHEFAHTSIDFVVPKGVHELGFVTGHGGATPCGLLASVLEIGQGGCLFHNPDMIRVE